MNSKNFYPDDESRKGLDGSVSTSVDQENTPIESEAVKSNEPPNLQTNICSYCKHKIKNDAIICPECSLYQGKRRFLNYLSSGATAATIIMAILVAIQLALSTSEREEINFAYKLAKEAEQKMVDVQSDIKNAETEIYALNKLSADATKRINNMIELDINARHAKYDINCLLKLKNISESDDYHYQDLQAEASRVYTNVVEDIKEWPEYMNLSEFNYKNDTTFYYWSTKDWEVNKFKSFYNELDSEYKGVYPKYIWDQDYRFSEQQIMDIMFHIIENTKNPYSIEVACSLIKEKFDLKFDTLFSKNEFIIWYKSKYIQEEQ